MFAKLQARYGLQFASQWKTDAERRLALQEWGERLAGLSPDEISRGLSSWAGSWPPNVEEFRQACEGHDTDWEHRGQAYRRFPKSLPKPKADARLVAEEIAKMRGILR